MPKKILKHFGYYFILLLIFAIGFIATIFSSPNLNLQILIIICTISFYVFWGIWHHKKTHELTNKIIIEYILIGLLGLSIIFFIFMGGVF